jgi:hypothetical protein
MPTGPSLYLKLRRQNHHVFLLRWRFLPVLFRDRSTSSIFPQYERFYSTAAMRNLSFIPYFLFALMGSVSAQFGFFDQMFGGGGQQEQRRPQNVPSDSSWYQSNVGQAHCDKYLCPDTLGTHLFPL